MRVIVGKRGSGKTEALIRLAAKESAYIVVADHKRAWIVERRAKEMDLAIPFPITFDEFVRKEWYGRLVSAFVIDDADDLVRWLAEYVPVLAITATEPDEDEEERFRLAAVDIERGWQESRRRRAEMSFFAGATAFLPPAEIAQAAKTFNAMKAAAFKDLGIPKDVLEGKHSET